MVKEPGKKKAVKTAAHFELAVPGKIVFGSSDPKMALVCDWINNRAENCQAVPWANLPKNLSTAVKRLTNAIERYA